MEEIMEEIDENIEHWFSALELLRKNFIGMSVSTFSSNMKKQRRIDWNMIEMLRETGKIRLVKYKAQYRTQTYVIFDPQYPACGNCKHWNDGISCDNIPYSFPLDACRHLERFEPKELESEEIPELDF